MDFFTLINLLLLTHRVACWIDNASCPILRPIRVEPFYGRVDNWIPDNFGHSPFNTFDEWHFQPEPVVEMFMSSSESIVLNVTLRCQQPDPSTGQLPPLSVWTGRQRREANEWSEENFGLEQLGNYTSLYGCMELPNGTNANGFLNAVSTFEAPLDWKPENVSRGFNFINEFIIARRTTPAGSNAKLVDFDLKWIVVEALTIILLTLFKK